MAASNTPHVVVAGLACIVHVATSNEHEPRLIGVGGVGSRRPVVLRLHTSEWIVF